MKRFFVLVLALGFVIAGCAKKKEEKGGQYLAKVGDTVITDEYLNKEIAALPVREQKMFKGDKGISNLIDGIVIRELLYQEAKKKGFDKDPIYPKKAENAQKTVLITSLLEKEIEDKAKVSDKEVKDFYEKNKEDFTVQGKPIEFERIKDMLAQRLTVQKQKEVFDSYVEDLKKSYTIDINKEAVATLSKSGLRRGEREEPLREEPKKEAPKEQVKEVPKK